MLADVAEDNGFNLHNLYSHMIFYDKHKPARK